jgi:hypothetical protein
LQGVTQRPATIRQAQCQQVAEQVLDVNPHNDRVVGMNLAFNQRKMHLSPDDILISQYPKQAEFSVHQRISDPLYGLFILHSVANQLRNCADFDAVLSGENFQIWPPGHPTVLVEDFNDHRRRFQTGQPGQITTGLGMTRAGQHGKIWPGCTRSSGRASGRTAVRMVWARS